MVSCDGNLELHLAQTLLSKERFPSQKCESEFRMTSATHNLKLSQSLNLTLQDHRGARKEAEFFASNSLLQEVDDSFRLHDLLLDFIGIKCQGEDALVEEAVKRQSQYLGRLAVLRDYADNGQFLEGFYSLIGLWRKLIELCGNERLEVNAYNASLGELGGAESEDASHAFWAVGRLFGLQVGQGANSLCNERGGITSLISSV